MRVMRWERSPAVRSEKISEKHQKRVIYSENALTFQIRFGRILKRLENGRKKITKLLKKVKNLQKKLLTQGETCDKIIKLRR